MPADTHELINLLSSMLVEWEANANIATTPDPHRQKPMTREKVISLMQKARPAWDLLDTCHRDLGNQP